ncbi:MULTISPECIES: arsenic resistance N-acetyltransferase ArsN2 [Xanthomonas]|uniref:arsenic resistance N-acetyltransferase ArsN2 n=1 Tax=Xanthomonas TaxID=338 RepID=UPI001AD99C18|nr:arsenic resistance N-acetyltransferase ArsN2 [Xanthomonas sp. A6251]MBO9874383.1 GNAT family N-acetyltransferase [Xanthomonas sp. D-93]WNH46753.1 arsenic resistance N-acetyltransferase ArsN2 [Xanthomonas sp. A6251]
MDVVISLSQFDQQTEELLRSSGLPTSDLVAGHASRQFLAARQGGLLGTVAVEVHGEHGVLRSLCVAEGHRGYGLGRRLVQGAERWAVQRDVVALYLLTTTAQDVFAALGYVHCDRQQVPPLVRASRQFESLCPSSAVCMSKRL